MFIHQTKEQLEAQLRQAKRTEGEIHYLEGLYEKNCRIDPEDFKRYDIKRGLRNANGTGVAVGLTKVAAVYGYRVEGDKKLPTTGSLTYRGYDLQDLIEGYIDNDRFGFEEVTYLLLFGKMPTERELKDFNYLVDNFRDFDTFPGDELFFRLPSSNIMNKIQRVILSMYTFDENPDDISIPNVIRQEIDIIAKMPLIISYAYIAYQYHYNNKSLIVHRPQPGLSTAQNILHLIRDDSRYTDLEAKVLDLVLIVQAEHGGGNNSTFATHVVSSTGTDTYSALATAVGSLKGPKHGGANEKVARMVDYIRKEIGNLDDLDALEDILWRMMNKEAFDKSGLIYGMGHAIYTETDPRAELLKTRGYELALQNGHEADFRFVMNIEKISKKLFKRKYGEDAVICANVDLYTGLIYQILRIPAILYTPLFALARMSGWSAHRLEQISDEKILRPAYVTIPQDKQ
ncbi:MAG: citrate synthase [Eubacteriales bacterium]|nr:citrate synthase [Eubacteriales bacterium]